MVSSVLDLKQQTSKYLGKCKALFVEETSMATVDMETDVTLDMQNKFATRATVMFFSVKTDTLKGADKSSI